MKENYKKQFQKPDREFTPIPFWFWNDYLSEEEIERQIKDFNSKGVNGFVIHPRMGLPKEIEYLSDEYMHYVKFAVKKAAELDMIVVLYDEASYPSGSAHGLVVKANPEFASKGLRMSSDDSLSDGEKLILTLYIHKSGDTIDDVSETEKPGYEKRCFIQQFSHGTIRGVHYGEDDLEPCAPASADLLSAESTQMFLKTTHERYYECLKEYFGTTIIAFFTDEPNIMGRCFDKGLISWTDGFLEFYKSCGGNALDLPYLFENGNEDAVCIYKKAINKMMSENYYFVLSDWCAKHGVALTGHPEKSDDIAHLKYFQIPCQDIVWRYVAPEDSKGITGVHSTMGKCTSDSARHLGKRRNGNEVLGCCGPAEDLWAFTFSDMMWYFNWLFVRGNNIVYPHAFFYSLRDKRRDERPPDVGPNSPWWNEYNKISDYIKRMCQLLTDSVNKAQIAIICREDRLPWEPAKPLFSNQLEFNYLEAALLKDCTLSDKILIKEQKYSLAVIDNPDDLSEEEIKLLNEFSGKKLLYKCTSDKFTNSISAKTDEEFTALVKEFTKPDFEISAYIPDLRMSHIVKGETDFYILSNEGDDKITFELSKKGEIWNPWDGSFSDAPDKLTLNGRQLLIFVPFV